MKASVFIGTSVDGFIARANGELDWLPLTRGLMVRSPFSCSALARLPPLPPAL